MHSRHDPHRWNEDRSFVSHRIHSHDMTTESPGYDSLLLSSHLNAWYSPAVITAAKRERKRATFLSFAAIYGDLRGNGSFVSPSTSSTLNQTSVNRDVIFRYIALKILWIFRSLPVYENRHFRIIIDVSQPWWNCELVQWIWSKRHCKRRRAGNLIKKKSHNVTRVLVRDLIIVGKFHS